MGISRSLKIEPIRNIMSFVICHFLYLHLSRFLGNSILTVWTIHVNSMLSEYGMSSLFLAHTICDISFGNYVFQFFSYLGISCPLNIEWMLNVLNGLLKFYTYTQQNVTVNSNSFYCFRQFEQLQGILVVVKKPSEMC